MPYKSEGASTTLAPDPMTLSTYILTVKIVFVQDGEHTYAAPRACAGGRDASPAREKISAQNGGREERGEGDKRTIHHKVYIVRRTIQLIAGVRRIR